MGQVWGFFSSVAFQKAKLSQTQRCQPEFLGNLATLIVPFFLAALCHISWKTTAVSIPIAGSWWLDDRLICWNSKCDCPEGMSTTQSPLDDTNPWKDFHTSGRSGRFPFIPVSSLNFLQHAPYFSGFFGNNFLMHQRQKVIPQHKQFPCRAHWITMETSSASRKSGI